MLYLNKKKYNYLPNKEVAYRLSRGFNNLTGVDEKGKLFARIGRKAKNPDKTSWIDWLPNLPLF